MEISFEKLSPILNKFKAVFSLKKKTLLSIGLIPFHTLHKHLLDVRFHYRDSLLRAKCYGNRYAMK